ncbi:uncharacterized mitochondrial protein AtMg00810-like [Capsicum annuum]|uniref:uncharacterized mitochondrial protein AtMg00810-like n=1 Tax=Capsicum annuum TaxID=4072 RepID=UPI001FB08523|nr:uncharacterized mitochondrial protein AtMg00810-like [Capsicum annuum]
MEIKQTQNEVFVCQKKYMKGILKGFKMEECKSMSTSMNQREKLMKDDGAERVQEGSYRSLIGCLMYLTATGPDILYVVSVLYRFLNSPSELHMKAAKRVLRYVKGTIDYGFKFSKCQNFKLQGFFDSDWGGSADDMKSTSRKIFCDLGLEMKESTNIFVDNQAAIAISHNPVFHRKTKHFNVKLYFLRQVQKDGLVNLVSAERKSSWLIFLQKLFLQANLSS